MALLNCTHVIACMTPDTRGGMWVPYEYGRIRKFPGLSINTCTWLHPDIKNDPIPEFMCLGIRAFEETYIQQWLGREYAIWNKANCKLQKHNFQELENTKPLPIETSEELNKRELENSNPNMELRSVMKILKRLERKYLKSD